jgi:transposase-like protein
MVYWGWYTRDLRVGEPAKLLVRRERCRPCDVTEAVLPSFAAYGRLDAVGVVGAALEAMGTKGATTAGTARALDVPRNTVRGWRQRFAERAQLLFTGFARAAVALAGALPRLPGEPVAAAVAALRAAWAGALRRFGKAAGRCWRFANALVGSHLLTTNMDPPWRTG